MLHEIQPRVIAEFLRAHAELAGDDGFIEFRPLVLDGSSRIAYRWDVGFRRLDGWDCIEHDYDGTITSETLRANFIRLNELRDYFRVASLRRDPSEAADKIADIVLRGVARGIPINAYLGAQPRWRLGGEEDCVRVVTSIQADLDVGPKKPYATLDDARAAVLAFHGSSGIGPSREVGSGRGLQVWYDLKEEDDRLDAWETLSERVHEILKSDPLDLARILRIPGTINWQPIKYGEPLPVVLLDHHPERRHTLDEIADRLWVDIEGCHVRRPRRSRDRGAPHDSSSAPTEMPERVRRVIEALGIAGHQKKAWWSCEVCPCCKGGRDEHDRYTAIVTASGRLKCYRASCAARGDGLAPDQWLPPELAVEFSGSNHADADGGAEENAGTNVVSSDAGGTSVFERVAVDQPARPDPGAAADLIVSDHAAVLRAARERLVETIEEAIEWTAVDPKRVAILDAPVGLGKTRAALDALERRDRGAFLTQNHELRKEHQASYKGACGSHQGWAQLCLFKQREPETFDQIRRANERGHNPHRVCGTCPHRSECPLHHQPWENVVFSVHAAAVTLQPDFAGDVFIIDEDPFSELGETLVLGLPDLQHLVHPYPDPDVEGALARRRDAIRVVVDAMEGLQHRLVEQAIQRPSEFRYPVWICGDELRDELRAIVTAGGNTVAESDADRRLAVLAGDVQSGPRFPDLTVGQLRNGSWSGHPSPWLDDVLAAMLHQRTGPDILESVAIVVDIHVTKRGKLRGVETRVELRRARPRGLPEHALVLDGTARWTTRMLREASQTRQAVIDGIEEREVRVFRVDCPEEPGAVRRFEHVTTTFDARNCRGRRKGVPKGSGEALGVIQQVVREIALDGGPTTGLRVGLVTHKALADQLRVAWSGDPKAHPPLVKSLAGLRETGVLADLVVGHFHATRGTNRMRACHALIVLGDATPNLGIAGQWGRVFGVSTGTVIRAIARAEVEQAFGRVRPLEATAADPRWLFHGGRRRAWCSTGAVGSAAEAAVVAGSDETVDDQVARAFRVRRGRRRSVVTAFIPEEVVRQLRTVGRVDAESVVDAIEERFGKGRCSLRTVQRRLAEGLKGVPGIVGVRGAHGRVTYEWGCLDWPEEWDAGAVGAEVEEAGLTAA